MKQYREETVNKAAANGRLDILIDFHRIYKNKCYWYEETCSIAAEYGHLDCLKYLHENGCPWNEYTCYSAALDGHLDCLKYLHENGCPWNEFTCRYAALMGNLECLKYAHENGCPWDRYVCASAALYGNVECLKYAHKNGCPWSSNTCTCAAENGHIECLKYAYENGCPYPKEILSTIVKNILIPKWRAIFKIYQFIIYLKKRNVQKANTALRTIIDTIINDNRSLVDRIVEINYKIDKYKEIADKSLLKQTRKVKAQLDQLRCLKRNQ